MTKVEISAMTITPKALAVGRRILIKREQKGYTQAQLAAKIGSSEGAVAQYETGRSIARPARMELIAKELDTTVGWLLTGDEPDEMAKAQTKDELDALLMMRELGPTGSPQALAVLKALIATRTK